MEQPNNTEFPQNFTDFLKNDKSISFEEFFSYFVEIYALKNQKTEDGISDIKTKLSEIINTKQNLNKRELNNFYEAVFISVLDNDPIKEIQNKINNVTPIRYEGDIDYSEYAGDDEAFSKRVEEEIKKVYDRESVPNLEEGDILKAENRYRKAMMAIFELGDMRRKVENPSIIKKGIEEKAKETGKVWSEEEKKETIEKIIRNSKETIRQLEARQLEYEFDILCPYTENKYYNIRLQDYIDLKSGANKHSQKKAGEMNNKKISRTEGFVPLAPAKKSPTP